MVLNYYKHFLKKYKTKACGVASAENNLPDVDIYMLAWRFLAAIKSFMLNHRLENPAN